MVHFCWTHEDAIFYQSYFDLAPLITHQCCMLQEAASLVFQALQEWSQVTLWQSRRSASAQSLVNMDMAMDTSISISTLIEDRLHNRTSY